MIPTAASVVPIPSHLSIREANTLAGGGVVTTAALTAYALSPSACVRAQSPSSYTPAPLGTFFHLFILDDCTRCLSQVADG